MFKRYESFKIIKEPCQEVIELVNKDLPKYKFRFDPLENLYNIDNLETNDLISPTLPILKLYWIKKHINEAGGEIGALLTFGLLRDIRETYLLIGQDVSGKLFNLTSIVHKTQEGKIFRENSKQNLQDWGAGIVLNALDKMSGKPKKNPKKI